MKKIFFTLVAVLLFTAKVNASVYFETNVELSRAEQRCVSSGYKATYDTCVGKTAPSGKCPYSDTYFKSCSQKQWCINYNFRLEKKDCKPPFVATKVCDNGFLIYRNCDENRKKTCSESGYTHADKCKLSGVRCPHDSKYGICCKDKCKGYDVLANKIPKGYIQDGLSCKTCDGQIMVKVVEVLCDGFQYCEFGPEKKDTAVCLAGKIKKYTKCKTIDDVCVSQGYNKKSCKAYEAKSFCPSNSDFVKCDVDCLKLAETEYPNATIIQDDVINPSINPTKSEIRSMAGLSVATCNKKRPVITLDLESVSALRYQNIFDHDIYGVSFKLNFKEPSNLSFNGNIADSNVMLYGKKPKCLFSNGRGTVKGVVQFVNVGDLCSDIKVLNNSKLAIQGNLNGSIVLGENSHALILGDLNGGVKTENGANLTVKGLLSFEDKLNSKFSDHGLDFGKNSNITAEKGVDVSTTFMRLQENSSLNTSVVKLVSKSDIKSIPNLLSSISLYSGAKIFHQPSVGKNKVLYPIIDNDEKCENKYLLHIGSSYDKVKRQITLSPGDGKNSLWKCIDKL